MIGNLLGAVVRIVNAPIRAVENVMSFGESQEDERFFSKPLDALADEFENVDENKEPKT